MDHQSRLGGQLGGPKTGGKSSLHLEYAVNVVLRSVWCEDADACELENELPHTI